MHEYYSVARFRATYKGRVEALPDRSQWPAVDLGFKMYPPFTTRDVTFYDGFLVTFLEDVTNAMASMTFSCFSSLMCILDIEA